MTKKTMLKVFYWSVLAALVFSPSLNLALFKIGTPMALAEETVCADTDADGVCGEVDNCLAVANPDQADTDADGIGDVCDTPQCGNGFIESGETCDDSNIFDGDGCSATCQIEMTPLAPVCGNGVIETGETCDDSNVLDSDGCSAICQTETPTSPICGNGLIEIDEQCDDNNIENNDDCSSTCQTEITPLVPVCGNGTVETGEECDDSNTADGDDCSALCMTEEPVASSCGVEKSCGTYFTSDTSGDAAPIIKAKWEMNIDKDINKKYLGTDEAETAGGQFTPSGQYMIDKKIAVCAVVFDPDGVADINGVYTNVFYPENVWLGPNHESNRQGCGQTHGDEFTLNKLSKSDGLELLCDKIKNNNSNLPTWNTAGIYNYAEICNLDGELQKETTYVYCGEIALSYEDPSGDYRTLVMAQDKAGVSGTLENNFTYLPLTAFETDFTAISYDSVRLNTSKIISGDLTWNDTPSINGASVRNVGNTRLTMNVSQSDMGMGKTDGLWNVRFNGRVGSEAEWVSFWPEEITAINDPLDLSEMDEMDFSIDAFKFPSTHEGENYNGEMTLSATPLPHLTCLD